MGLGLLRLDPNSSIFDGSFYRRVMFASGTSVVWYMSAHRLLFTNKTIITTLPAVFFLSFLLSNGVVKQQMAYNYKVNEISKKQSESLTLYMRDLKNK